MRASGFARRQLLGTICIAGLLSAWVADAGLAQEVGDSVPAPAAQVQTPSDGISPRNAMIRSFLLWGWGQASVGSYTRGGVWFSMEASTIYMMFRTLTRLNQAKDLEDRVVTFATDSLNNLIATDSLEAERLSDPDVFDAAVEEGPGVATARKLVSARTQQRQDWITYAIFFTLMSGVDAYVNAHLYDFPTTIATEARRDGSVALSVQVPLPAWLGGSRPRPATGSSRAIRRDRW